VSQVFCRRAAHYYEGRVIPEGAADMSITTANAPSSAQPTTLSISSSLLWMVGMVVVGLAIYYLVGVDQGAWSVFGNDMHIHEFTHDARHFLGFPCH
jgi:hypothetical protein